MHIANSHLNGRGSFRKPISLSMVYASNKKKHNKCCDTFQKAFLKSSNMKSKQSNNILCSQTTVSSKLLFSSKLLGEIELKIFIN